MASFTFQNLPEIEDVSVSGQDILVTVELVGAEDANGTTQSGPSYQTFVIRSPLAVGGDQALKRIAVAATSDAWKSKPDEDGPTAKFTLDSKGFEISYDCKRLLIDGWQFRPSAHGAGYEEVLALRAFEVERRHDAAGQIDFKPGAKKS